MFVDKVGDGILLWQNAFVRLRGNAYNRNPVSDGPRASHEC